MDGSNNVSTHRPGRSLLKSVRLFSGLVLCLTLIGRIQGQEQNAVDLSSSQWITLREVDGEWVVYHFCFAGMGTITLGPSESGGTEFIVFSGQDSEIFDVVTMSRGNNAIILRIKSRFGEQRKDIVFRYVDAAGHIGEWEGLHAGFPAVRSVLNMYQSEVRHVYENNGNCDPDYK
jgi:hypothetical protein